MKWDKSPGHKLIVMVFILGGAGIALFGHGAHAIAGAILCVGAWHAELYDLAHCQPREKP